MRLLLDENMPADAVEALRLAGHDVAFVTEDDPSAADPDLLARTVREDRVLVTFDTDYGSLTYRDRLPATCGVVTFRLIPDIPADAQARLVAGAITAQDGWRGYFWVISLRRRPLPT